MELTIAGYLLPDGVEAAGAGAGAAAGVVAGVLAAGAAAGVSAVAEESPEVLGLALP